MESNELLNIRTKKDLEQDNSQVTNAALTHPTSASPHSSTNIDIEGAANDVRNDKGATKSQGHSNDGDEELDDDKDSTSSEYSLARHLMSEIEPNRRPNTKVLEPSPRLILRTKKARRRMLQTADYTKLLEDRLSYVENVVRHLLRQPERPEVENEPHQLLENKIEAEKLNWSEFYPSFDVPPGLVNIWKHRPELEDCKKPIIEILVEDPSFFAPVLGSVRKRILANFSTGHRFDSGNNTDSVTQRSIIRGGAPYRIRIRSRILLKLLEHITGMITTVGPHKHRILFLQPFKFLVKHAEDIQHYLDNNPHPIDGSLAPPRDANTQSGPINQIETPEALQQLRFLYDVIEECLKPKIDLFRGNVNMTKGSRVAFSDLWCLFTVGTEVRTSGKIQVQLYQVFSTTGGRPTLSPTRRGPSGFADDRPDDLASTRLRDQGYTAGSFVITCLWIGFDGEQFGPVYQHVIIRPYSDEKPIHSLPIYPIHYDPERHGTLARLQERGDKFTRLSNPTRPAHKNYKGMTLDKRPEKVESKIIIDFQLAFIEQPENRPDIVSEPPALGDEVREVYNDSIYNPVCGIMGCCGNDYIHQDYEIDEMHRTAFRNNKILLETYTHSDTLSSAHKRLLPPRLFGFVLRSRRWAVFDIDLVNEREASDNEEPWKHLVIDESIKSTVLALVDNHQTPQGSHRERIDSGLASVDLIQAKGRGLIMLLHGEPGVGKTSTAECVAEYTKRPLFPITCGDIGDNAKSVETNLEKNFQLAHKWGCVLLLDEADSKGILFLTTNRVGNIDRAFKSRIHLSLYYPSLDKMQTIEIWKNNLELLKKELEKEGKTTHFREKKILKFAANHFDKLQNKKLLVWNGRQIRNAFQTAIAIANYETNQKNNMVLGAKQFEKVAKIARRFDEYLQKVYRGKNDAQLALESGSRYDDFLRFSYQTGMIPPGAGRVAPVPISHGSAGEYGESSSKKRQRQDDDSSEEEDLDDTGDSTSESDESEQESDEPKRGKHKRLHLESNFRPVAGSMQRDKINMYIKHGREQDEAKVLYDGSTEDQKYVPTQEGFWVPPVIVMDCTDDMRVTQEESFGSVICILPY
ncbi:hypothetical protein FSARC_341 [Fusarium sarcochroum]|uniref:AAA+ ATPase domain-containing protein n=1 Tax=Fusarium sarcochroum TaxID=1208366 RepID=A0A8H4UBH3_9HYPO|nr:hypothetical protein FSARC_341 [Fusarium sarcochroum]